MDFWDLTKLLVRRWYFAVPMLTITAIAALVTYKSVPPKWIATSYVQLLTPVSESAPALGTPTLDQRNPWVGVGPYALANAAMLAVQDTSVLQELADSGLSDTFTATQTSGLPTVTFAVTGDSQDQATKSADFLVTRYDQIVTHLQDNVAPKDRITTKRLNIGANIKESSANVKRAFVAVFAAGLLLSVGLTVGIDALLARRARRRQGVDDDILLGPAMSEPDRPLGWPDSKPKSSDARPGGRPPVRSRFADRSGSTDLQRARPIPTIVLPAEDPAQADVDRDDAESHEEVNGRPTDQAMDSTVVLPPTPGWGRPGRKPTNG